MDENTFKHRIIGAIVLVTLGVIFIPMLLSGHRNDIFHDENVIPVKPAALENIKAFELEQPLPKPVPQAVKRTSVEKKTSKNKKTGVIQAPKIEADKKQESQPQKKYSIVKAVPKNSQTSLSNPLVKAWAVQVGSFSHEENALRLREKLRRKGYPAFVEKITTKNKNVFRVRIGPEVRRNKAEKIQAEIKTKLDLKSIVVAHP